MVKPGYKFGGVVNTTTIEMHKKDKREHNTVNNLQAYAESDVKTERMLTRAQHPEPELSTQACSTVAVYMFLQQSFSNNRFEVSLGYFCS